MTEEQRADLQIEWQITSKRVKEIILYAYSISLGPKDDPEHFDQYFVKVLNLEQSWARRGLL